MNDLPTSWKIFRVICILQMIAVALQLIFSAGSLLFGGRVWFSIFQLLVYLTLFAFLYQGLSLINYNYPATPLPTRQKKLFNWLFLINFLSIAFLFGKTISEWRLVAPYLKELELPLLSYMSLCFSLALSVFIFLVHIFFLTGIVQLRRLIYRNMYAWEEEFGRPDA